MRWMAGLAVLALAAPFAVAGSKPAPLRSNDISVIGTHNSYKQAMPAETMKAIRAYSVPIAESLDYAHRPLAEQLDAGARQLELDVNYDPRGGHYAKRSTDPKLLQPGFKVLHIAGIDNASSCVLLRECLGIIARWSAAHPRHVPIMLLFNAKDEQYASRGGIDALPFDAAAWDALDAEIRAAMPAGSIITPDEVQGHYPTCATRCAPIIGRRWNGRADGSCSCSTRRRRRSLCIAARGARSKAACSSSTPTRTRRRRPI
jgi:hypothetical protein